MPAAPTAAISIGWLGYFSISVVRYGWVLTASPKLGGSLCLRDRCHNAKARTAMAAALAAEPTPIPALAPVESSLPRGLLVMLLPLDVVCVAETALGGPTMVLPSWIVIVTIIVLVTWTVVWASRNEVLVTKLVD